MGRERRRPGQAVGPAGGVREVALRQLFEEILEISARFQAVFFGGLNETHGDRAGLRSARRVGKEPVFAARHKGFDGPFTAVVVHLESSILEKSRQRFPLIQAIGHRLAQGTLGQGVPFLPT